MITLISVRWCSIEMYSDGTISQPLLNSSPPPPPQQQPTWVHHAENNY